MQAHAQIDSHHSANISALPVIQLYCGQHGHLQHFQQSPPSTPKSKSRMLPNGHAGDGAYLISDMTLSHVGRQCAIIIIGRQIEPIHYTTVLMNKLLLRKH
jgi:hypothetical protein